MSKNSLLDDKRLKDLRQEDLNVALYETAFSCSPEAARLLIKIGASVNVRDGARRTPLHVAVEKECIDMVDLLIEAKADVNAKDVFGQTPLHYAAYKGNVEIVRRLIAAGADVNAEEEIDGNTPLHVALMKSKEDVALELINAGADVAKANRQGKTPLHLAARECLIRAAEELLKRGAPVDAVDEEGNTPLHYAVECCIYKIGDNIKCCSNKLHSKMMSLLLNYGADVKVRNKIGETVLLKFLMGCEFCKKWTISTEDCEDGFKILINAGADVVAADADGITPLHIAARAGYLTVVETLLKMGAPPDVEDAKGATPLNYAKRSGRHEVVELLTKHLRKREQVEEATATKVMNKAGVKITIKLKRDGGYVDYDAKIGDAIEMSGYTRGGRDEVKQVIRRALKGKKPLPNRVKEIALSIVRQVLLWLDMYKVEAAAAGMAVDIGEYSDLHVSIRLRYDADKGWVAELFATLDGFDGFADALHRIVRKVELGKRIDNVAVSLLLQINLLKVAKYAYNIYVEDDKSSYFDDDDDSSYDYFDDDDDHGDDGDTSLKILAQ